MGKSKSKKLRGINDFIIEHNYQRPRQYNEKLIEIPASLL